MSYNLTVTFKSQPNQPLPSGFNKTTLSLVVPYVKYSESLETVINNLNQYRDPDSQITKIYNQYGKELNRAGWKVNLLESATFYVNLAI
jgi:hypothetical protein